MNNTIGDETFESSESESGDCDQERWADDGDDDFFSVPTLNRFRSNRRFRKKTYTND